MHFVSRASVGAATAAHLFGYMLAFAIAIPPTDRAGTFTGNIGTPEAEANSDMLMEADERHDTPLYAAGIQRQRRYDNDNDDNNSFRPIAQFPTPAAAIDRSTLADEGSTPAAQNYFPQFLRNAPPLGHSRPYYPEMASRFIPSPTPVSGPAVTTRAFDQTVLGSGDFTVVPGGTFYQDEDPPFRGGESNDYYQFYNANNGHGRPHTAPYVQRFTYPEDQFANFKDFADINTPNDGAFSHYVVVYANHNTTDNEPPLLSSSPTPRHNNPKNIFEQLQALDREESDDVAAAAAAAAATATVANGRDTKASKTKVKLSATMKKTATNGSHKKYQKFTGPKDYESEPLLALS